MEENMEEQLYIIANNIAELVELYLNIGEDDLKLKIRRELKEYAEKLIRTVE
jgi:hypothetical protein